MSFEIKLSRRRQQALALALAAVPILVVVAVAVGLVLSWSAYHARVAVLMTERANYRRVVDEAPTLRSTLATLRATEAAQNYFFASNQSSAAAAKVRSQIGAIVGGDGATIARDDVELTAAGDDSPVELRASVSFTGDIRSLSRVLYHLRQARPLLFVTQLAVHSGSDGAALTAPNRLQADLVVEAYLGTP